MLGHGPQSQQGTPKPPAPHFKVILSKEPKSPCSQHGALSPGLGSQKAQMTLMDRHTSRVGDTQVGSGTHTEDLEQPTSTRQGHLRFCQPWGHTDHCTCSGVRSGGGVGALIIPRAQGRAGLLVGQVDQGQPRGPKASADFSGRSERRARCCVSVQRCGLGPPLCPPNSGVQTMTHSTHLPPKPSAVPTRGPSLLQLLPPFPCLQEQWSLFFPAEHSKM